MKQVLSKIPFYLLLIAVFFCLHGSVENFGSLYAREVVLTGISLVLFIAGLFGLLLLILRKMYPAALLSFFISVWFLFFGALQDLVRSFAVLKPLSRYAVFLPLIGLFTVCWAIFLFKKSRLWPRLTLFLNILLLLYCAFDTVNLFVRVLSSRPAARTVAFKFDAVKNRDDVYLLLFDEYPGEKSLTDSFQFTNAAMMDFLKARSFKMLPSRSNYNTTQFSMASLFNMNYIYPPRQHAEITQADILKRQREINDGEVFWIFSKMGYTIENNSIFDVNDMPGVYHANKFLMGHRYLLTDKIFVQRLSRDMGPDFQKKWLPFLGENAAERQKEENSLLEENLLKSLSVQHTKPLFSYSHFLMPHSPFFFDSTGVPTPASFYNVPDSALSRGHFISYLKYTNKVIMKLIAEIMAKKPGATVILMSDHGYREYNRDPGYQPAQFNNICAVHFPDNDFGNTADSVMNVNFFRYLFNTRFEQNWLISLIVPFQAPISVYDCHFCTLFPLAQ